MEHSKIPFIDSTFKCTNENEVNFANIWYPAGKLILSLKEPVFIGKWELNKIILKSSIPVKAEKYNKEQWKQ